MSMARRHVFVWLIFLLGVIIRVGYVLALPPTAIEPDEVDYVRSAAGLAAEGSFEQTVYYHVPPVVPVLFAGLFLLTGPSYLAARLLQCMLFVLLGWILYWLGVEVLDRRAGLLAVGFGAVYPYFIYFSGRALSETAATVAIAGCMLFAVRAVRSRTTVDVLGFGFSLAVASLTRAAVLYFVLAIPLVYAIGWGVRQWGWIRATMVTLTAFLVLYLPWVAVNYGYFGEFIPSPTIGGGVMLYQTALRITMPDEGERTAYLKDEILPRYYYPENASHHDRLEGDRFLQREGARIIGENPGAYLRVVWSNLKRFWQPYPHQSDDPSAARRYMIVGLTSFGVLLPFFITGLVERLRAFRALSVLYGFMAYFTLVHVLLYGRLRYRVPMDSLFLVFAAAVFVWWLSRAAPAVLGRIDLFAGLAPPLMRKEKP